MSLISQVIYYQPLRSVTRCRVANTTRRKQGNWNQQTCGIIHISRGKFIQLNLITSEQ